jgi:predicted LPLAT superfamily acyltransferase
LFCTAYCTNHSFDRKVGSLYIFGSDYFFLFWAARFYFCCFFWAPHFFAAYKQRPVNAITAIDFNVHYDVILSTLSIFFNTKLLKKAEVIHKIITILGKLALWNRNN